MRTRVGFFSTRSAHFCGLGPHVGCGQDDALAAYRNLLASGPVANSAVPATQDEFLREYYLRRYFLPYFRFLVLWKLFAQWPIELLLGWNLGFEQPGTPNAQFQLPQNKYSELFPNGEAGRHSTMRIGFFSEAIDLEAWPTRGHRALVLVRAADAWSGSSWSFWGIHADFIGYFRFPHKSGNVVATRLLYDEIRGRVPSLELSQVTGLQDVSAFGGPWLGRGIRERRFSGHQKLIYQGEYRVPLAALRVFQHRLGLAVASFLDLAWIRFSPDVPNEFAPYETSDRGLFGLGMGLQLLLDQLFLFRVDVATSPQETQGPYVYAVMGAAF